MDEQTFPALPSNAKTTATTTMTMMTSRTPTQRCFALEIVDIFARTDRLEKSITAINAAIEKIAESIDNISINLNATIANAVSTAIISCPAFVELTVNFTKLRKDVDHLLHNAQPIYEGEEDRSPSPSPPQNRKRTQRSS